MSLSPRGERRFPRLAIGVVLLVLGVGGALWAFGDSGDVFNPEVGFVDTTEETPSETAPRARADGHPADDGFRWPIYGYTKSRTHHLPLAQAPRPPYRQAWAVRGSVLLEFSPVLCGRRVYLLKNNAALYAISRATGRISWKRKLGTLAASAPACDGKTIYSVMLRRWDRAVAGRIVAVSAKTGRTRWSRNFPSRAESSPLLHRGRLYAGTEDGTVYSLRTSDGSVRWRSKAPGAVKGALALDNNKLYFGDYAGQVHAIRRSNGAKVWSVSPGDGRLGLGGGGNFYSSAAVRYGRVYIGSTNGDVYSLSSADGKLAWRRSTGGFVYASPAVGQVRGGRPTVYVGSYDGKFYALDARTGTPRWVRSLGTKISGAAAIIGDLVFVSDLDKRTTWALGARTGRTVWKTRRGGFQPAISDGRRIYFTGYTSLFALDQRGRPFDRESSAAVRERAQAQRAAARERAKRRAVARAKARRERQLRYRFAPHGHRHSRGVGYGRHCHPHRHVYKVRDKTIVLRHNHCHNHTRGR
ncbi:MAG: PQQ-binding-like beta-propeller repeat protein [Solirubrobacteraceae bacterium]|nr:PQQ-binding-like beta-propeller repeat protein [Solirubrobacteraceae bacterium]